MEIENKYHEKEKILHSEIIEGVISANSGSDLHKELVKINNWKWMDGQRKMFLLGLLQGALMQFKKDIAISELREIFKV